MMWTFWDGWIGSLLTLSNGGGIRDGICGGAKSQVLGSSLLCASRSVNMCPLHCDNDRHSVLDPVKFSA